jgi:hypothetical protein
MKQSKLLIFSVHGKPVEEFPEAENISLTMIDNIKTSVAIMHGVSYDDVDVVTKDVFIPEKSESCFVSGTAGTLMFRANENAYFVPVNGISPAMDITKEELFYEFLDHITKQEIDKAIIFRK